LFSLTLTGDGQGNVSAGLLFGSSNSNFSLDFRDSLGNVFSPSDPAKIQQIQNSIVSAFSHGTLTADLSDLFTVGFTPTASTTEFTLGKEDAATVNGVETPLPTTAWMGLVGLGSLIGVRLASRRR
jgi:hypothetical protein